VQGARHGHGGQGEHADRGPDPGDGRVAEARADGQPAEPGADGDADVEGA